MNNKNNIEFIKILKNNPNINFILSNLNFPNGLKWYLVGGCINQTIWNHLTSRAYEHGIGDYDIFYWNDNLSESKEKEIQEIVVSQLKDLNCRFDVVNQARVHKWFTSYFGKKMKPYNSLEQAIESLPSTVTCVGITNDECGIRVFSPFGLEDIFDMKLRYNSMTPIPAKFVKIKLDKWIQKWPELEIVKNSYPNE